MNGYANNKRNQIEMITKILDQLASQLTLTGLVYEVGREETRVFYVDPRI